jgi:hypothetical protein
MKKTTILYGIQTTNSILTFGLHPKINNDYIGRLQLRILNKMQLWGTWITFWNREMLPSNAMLSPQGQHAPE